MVPGQYGQLRSFDGTFVDYSGYSMDWTEPGHLLFQDPLSSLKAAQLLQTKNSEPVHHLQGEDPNLVAGTGVSRIETDEMALAAKRAAEEAAKERTRLGWHLLNSTGDKPQCSKELSASGGRQGSESVPEPSDATLVAPHTSQAASGTVVGSMSSVMQMGAKASVGFALSNLDYAMANLPAVSSLAANALPTRLSQITSIWGSASSRPPGLGMPRRMAEESSISSRQGKPDSMGGEELQQQAINGLASVAEPTRSSNAKEPSLVILTILVVPNGRAICIHPPRTEKHTASN